MLSLENTGSRMSHLARQEIYFGRQFGLDELLAGIEAVEADDVQRIARTRCSRARSGMSILGNLGGYRPKPRPPHLAASDPPASADMMGSMRRAILPVVLALGLAACEERTPVASSAVVDLNVTPTPVPVRLGCPQQLPGQPQPPELLPLARSDGHGRRDGRRRRAVGSARDRRAGQRVRPGADAPHARPRLDRRPGRHRPRASRSASIAFRPVVTNYPIPYGRPNLAIQMSIRFVDDRGNVLSPSVRIDVRVSLRFRVLGSGSTGNATLVEGEAVRILIDAGLGPRELAERLQSVGVDPASVDAIFLSHEHQDHSKGAVSFSRKWGVRLCGSRGTYAAMGLGAETIAGYDVLKRRRPRGRRADGARRAGPARRGGPVRVRGRERRRVARPRDRLRPLPDRAARRVPRLRRGARRVEPRSGPAAPRRVPVVAEGAHPGPARARLERGRRALPRARPRRRLPHAGARAPVAEEQPPGAGGGDAVARCAAAGAPRSRSRSRTRTAPAGSRWARRPRASRAEGSSSGCSDDRVPGVRPADGRLGRVGRGVRARRPPPPHRRHPRPSCALGACSSRPRASRSSGAASRARSRPGPRASRLQSRSSRSRPRSRGRPSARSAATGASRPASIPTTSSCGQGPYRVVRHPIYTSMLCMLVGTGLLVAAWPVLAAAFALEIAGTEVRVRVEDALLAARFGEAFEAYRRAVPAYVPYVRCSSRSACAFSSPSPSASSASRRRRSQPLSKRIRRRARRGAPLRGCIPDRREEPPVAGGSASSRLHWPRLGFEGVHVHPRPGAGGPGRAAPDGAPWFRGRAARLRRAGSSSAT